MLIERKAANMDGPESARRNRVGSLESLWLLSDRCPREDRTGIDRPLGPRALKTLRLFHFNDLHHALVADPVRPSPLFSRIVGRYREARHRAGEDEVVLLLSIGDDHTGTPFDELLGWSRDELIVDPAYAVYSAAGVDIAALGNHDLDRGSEVLAAGIERSARFPILSANIRGSAQLIEGTHYFPAAVGIAKSLRIGFIGLTTAIDTRVGTALDPGLCVSSPLAALERWLPIIADESDVVIVMSHCGYGADDRDAAIRIGHPYLPEGDVALARVAARITGKPLVIVGGHTHTVLNTERLDTIVDGIPILQAGGHGSHVGEFVATIAPSLSRAHWNPVARLHSLGGTPRNPGRRSAIDESDTDWTFENEVIAPIAAMVRARVEDVIATAGDDPALRRARTLADRYCGECALANFITDALVARSRDFAHGPVDLAIVNSTAIADGLPAERSISFSDWYRVQPFADCLQVAMLSAAQLTTILASNARRIVRPDEAMVEGGFEGYISRGFLHFSSGLRYAVQLGEDRDSATAVDATLAGVALAALQTTKLRVVFTNYLGSGGETWNGSEFGAAGRVVPFDLRALPREDTGLVFRNEVITHIRTVGHVGEATGARVDGRLQVIR